MFNGRLLERLGDSSSHLFLGEPTDLAVRSYCNRWDVLSKLVALTEQISCIVCSGDNMESDIHISGPEATLGEDEYRKVFNGSIVEDINLVKQTKPIGKMSDEELTAFIYEMERFVKLSRIITQAARVNLEDRKLRYTTEQKEALKAFDKTYKPKPVNVVDKSKPRKERDAPLPKNSFEKKLAALVNLMDMSESDAIAYLASMGITRDNLSA